MNWKTEAAVDLALALALTLWITAAHAENVCKSVFNPMTGQYDWVCVERPDNGYQAPPVCRQQFDPMTGQWHSVCQ